MAGHDERDRALVRLGRVDRVTPRAPARGRRALAQRRTTPSAQGRQLRRRGTTASWSAACDVRRMDDARRRAVLDAVRRAPRPRVRHPRGADAGRLGAHRARARAGWGTGRVEAKVEPDNEASLRVATRSGLRREGVRRVGRRHRRPRRDPRVRRPGAAGRATRRSASPTGFRALLNSFLPRKRAIGQMLVRDPDGGCCSASSPTSGLGPARRRGRGRRVAAARRRPRGRGGARPDASPAGDLLLTDWLPPWGGWDDALCLVFDGGVTPPAVIDRDREAGPRDPGRGVLHARAGPGALRRLHRAPGRGGACPTSGGVPGLHRVWPLTRPPPPAEDDLGPRSLM